MQTIVSRLGERGVGAATCDRLSALLSRVVTQVAPPARRTLESGLTARVHGPLLGASLLTQARRTPAALAGRYLAYAAKRARLVGLAPAPVGGHLYPRLAAWRDAWIDRGLSLLCRSSPGAAGQQALLGSLAAAEHAVARRQADAEQLRALLELSPTESRLVRDLTFGPGPAGSESLRDVLWPAEILAYAAHDLRRYAADPANGRTTCYAAFVVAYGADAPDRLRAELDAYRRLFAERLGALDPALQAEVRRRCEPELAAALDPFPVPVPPPDLDEGAVADGVSTAVVLFGMVCVLGWLVAYAGIIRRGFADHTFGVPLPALVANLSWEFAYGFLLDPLGDYFHTSSIAGFLVDTVIAGQTWAYGADQFAGTFLGEHFRPLFLLGLAIAFPVTYWGFLDLADPDGEYTGFGINLMMSIGYLAMLGSRRSSAGQSMYIAVGKWLGTFCAWAATALTVTTTPGRTWPTSVGEFVTRSLGHRSYPLTPLVNVMYGWTFVLDAAYTVALYRQLRREGVSPWRRF